MRPYMLTHLKHPPPYASLGTGILMRPPVRRCNMDVAGVGWFLDVPCVSVGHAPIRVAAETLCVHVPPDETRKISGGAVHVRRGTVFVYRRDIEAWVIYNNIHEAVAAQEHILVGYGLRHMLPKSEMERLESMILNTDGAREIMHSYRSMLEAELHRALSRLANAASEYRMPRVPGKVRARDLLATAAAFMSPADISGHGRNPGAALAVTLPARAALVERQRSIREDIGPRITHREAALLAERTFCLTVFGRLADLLSAMRESPVFSMPARTPVEALDIEVWHRDMRRLRHIAHGLESLVLPAPYARSALRIANELERAAIELEARNFPAAQHLVDIVLRSLDFLTIAERIADTKLALCELARDTSLPLPEATSAAVRACLVVYGLCALLDDNGFSNPTSSDIMSAVAEALVLAKGYRLHATRIALTLAARMCG